MTFVITDGGKELLTKAMAGETKLTFTQASTSDKSYTEETAAKLTKLDSIKQTVTITDLEKTDSKVELSVLVDNQSLTKAYSIRAIGIYAQDDSGTATLLGVAIETVNPDYMPVLAGKELTEYEYVLTIVMESTSQITIEVDPLATATKEDLGKVASRIDALETDKVDNSADGANALLLNITDGWTDTPTDDTNFIRQDAGGASSFGRVKFSTIWDYIKTKLANATTKAAGLMSAADKTKLNGIATGAEVNVQSDWSATDTASDAYIANKPTLATVATSGSYNDLKNKPSIPAKVTVDAAISATSTNAIQNKIVFNGDYGVLAKTTTFNGDTITEVDGNGYTRTTTFNSDGSITEQIADSSAKIVATKTTVFNADGSISESIS